MVMMTKKTTGFSAEQIFQLRSTASRAIQRHSLTIERIAEAVAELDAALRLSLTERSADENIVAINAANHLAAVLESEASV